MISYVCENIVLDDDASTNLNAKVLVSVEDGDMSTPLDRYDHLVAITGALENAVGNPISCFSYNRVQDGTN
jgi:hypothetical protein